MPDAARVPSALEETLSEILEHLIAIEAFLQARQPAADADPRYERFIASLAGSMDDHDYLPFSASEVLQHRGTDYDLDESLKALHVRNTEDLGVLFRGLRNRDIGDFRLVRGGRLWRLVRTSCT
jgi:hypothetical protein